MSDRREMKESSRTVGAYIGSIVALGIVLFLVNKLPDWNLRFITDDYPAVLWAMNLSLLVQLAGNAILIFLHPRFLHYLMQTVFNVVSLLSLIVLTAVYPLDFSYFAGNFVNTIVRIALIIATVATGIGAIVNLFKTIGSIVNRRG
jgi:hypothetical protein